MLPKANLRFWDNIHAKHSSNFFDWSSVAIERLQLPGEDRSVHEDNALFSLLDLYRNTSRAVTKRVSSHRGLPCRGQDASLLSRCLMSSSSSLGFKVTPGHSAPDAFL